MTSRELTGSLRETLAVFETADGVVEPMTTSEVTERNDVSRRSTYERLERLVDRGFLETKKVGASGRIWWRPAADTPDDERHTDSPTANEESAEPTDAGRDAGEQRAAERQRAEIAAELDTVFERIDDAFFALDEEWRFTYVNDTAAELVQLPAAELLGAQVWEALPDVAEGRPRETAERAMETQESVEFEFHSGMLGVWIGARVYPSESGMSVYFRDVTDRKERERERELYETVFSAVDDGVYVLDEDFHFTKVNDAYAEMTGYGRDELLGTHCSLVVSEDVSAESAERLEEVVEAGGGGATLEADIRRADGSRVSAESRFTTFPSENDERHGKVGVVRDISERKERERQLREQFRQQEAIAELGRSALDTDELDALMAEASDLVAETLGNDYCKVLDLDADAEELLLRQGVGWDDGFVGEATVSAVEDDSQAAYTLSSSEPVVVTDLDAERRFSGPDLLRNHDVRSGVSVVVGSLDDPWGILGTHDTECKEFSGYDVNFVQSVANILAIAIDRHADEQELRRQREQLGALNSLNVVVRDITDAVIEQSTREQIEQTVCERLADTDSYEFAWIGGVAANSKTVELRAEHGVEGYLDGITISVDPDDGRNQGPTARALRTGELRVTQDLPSDFSRATWRDNVERYGVRSSAAIPIVHEDTVYGVLNVYAERPNAFEGQERTVIDQLGEVVGHAIAAVERKRALMGDEVVELAFQIQDIFGVLGVPTETQGRITLDQTVPVADGDFLVYGTATPDAVDSLTSIVDAVPHWEEVSFHSGSDPPTFELRLSDPPVLSTVASIGGYVDSAAIADGDYQMTIHLAPSAEVRRVIDTVEEAYPEAEMLRRRQVSRSNDDSQALLGEELTDRQRSALEAAYHAGFFDWPRESSGEDVAETLGVSPPTFHQHLRKAQKKVLDSLMAASERL